MQSKLSQYHAALKKFRSDYANIQSLASIYLKLANQLKGGAEALIVEGLEPAPNYFISPTYAKSIVTMDAASFPTAQEVGESIAAFQQVRAELHTAYAALTIEEQHDITAPVKVGAGVP